MDFNIEKLIDNNASAPNVIKIIFLHHSTGRRLIYQGGMRGLFAEHNNQSDIHLEFWEHDYNRIGLVDVRAKRIGYNFNIPDDNTDPDGLEKLFSQEITSPPNNAFSKLLIFDVIVFKSCFPVSAITSDEQYERYQRHYYRIRETIAQNPSKLFIAMTPPPLIPLKLPVFAPGWTNRKDAARARRFSRWMQSKELWADLENIAVFDFFDLLAGAENQQTSPNMLRPEYRGIFGLDSHPNRTANRAIAPIFVQFIIENVQKFFQNAPLSRFRHHDWKDSIR